MLGSTKLLSTMITYQHILVIILKIRIPKKKWILTLWTQKWIQCDRTSYRSSMSERWKKNNTKIRCRYTKIDWMVEIINVNVIDSVYVRPSCFQSSSSVNSQVAGLQLLSMLLCLAPSSSVVGSWGRLCLSWFDSSIRVVACLLYSHYLFVLQLLLLAGYHVLGCDQSISLFLFLNFSWKFFHEKFQSQEVVFNHSAIFSKGKFVNKG